MNLSISKNNNYDIVDIKGEQVLDNKPIIYKLGLRIQKFLNGGFSKNMGIITKMCENEKTNKDVSGFANKYKINYKSVKGCEHLDNPEDCWKKFPSVNDFFTRQRINLPPQSPNYYNHIFMNNDRDCKLFKDYKNEIKNNFSYKTLSEIDNDYYSYLREKDISNQENQILLSPVDSFTVFLSSNHSNIWVKGKNFSKETLTGNNNVRNYELIIFRLTLQHYHRFHCPVSGYIEEIKYLGHSYYSVDSILVNSSVDVLTENIRMVLTIRTITKNPIRLFYIIVGAQCVGSIQFTNMDILDKLYCKSNGDITNYLKTNKQITFLPNEQPLIHVLDELGYFQFGGSTVIIAFPEGTYRSTNIGDILKKNTNNSHHPIETELLVGDYILKFNSN